MKIAFYKCLQYEITNVYEFSEYMEENADYIRASEIVDIEIKLLPDKEINKQEIAAVDVAINKFMAETELKLGELKQKRAELLAISDMSED